MDSPSWHQSKCAVVACVNRAYNMPKNECFYFCVLQYDADVDYKALEDDFM